MGGSGSDPVTLDIPGGMADISPDDRVLAYTKEATVGPPQVWVASFPDGDIQLPVSFDGGIEPVWARESGELFFRNGDEWMVVQVSSEPELNQTVSHFLCGHTRLLV